MSGLVQVLSQVVSGEVRRVLTCLKPLLRLLLLLSLLLSLLPLLAPPCPPAARNQTVNGWAGLAAASWTTGWRVRSDGRCWRPSALLLPSTRRRESWTMG